MKKFCYLSLILFISQGLHASSILTFLLGQQPDNSIQVGSAFNHLFNKSYPTIMWKPNIGVTYHSINASIFQSCDNDKAVGIGVQRSLTRYDHNDNHLAFGYKAGLTYGGWCYTGKDSSTASKPACQGKIPLMPIAQIYLDYSYKNIGIEITDVRDIITLSVLYRFDSTSQE